MTESNARWDWERELADLQRAPVPVRQFPNHVHATTPPPRAARSVVAPIPLVQPRVRSRAVEPIPPESQVRSPYPPHIREAIGDVEEPSAPRRGPAREGFGEVLGLDHLDLRPSFPAASDGFEPPPVQGSGPVSFDEEPRALPAAPPPARSRREAVRPLATVPAGEPPSPVLPPGGELASLFRSAAAHAEALRVCFERAAQLVEAATPPAPPVPVPENNAPEEPPAPEVTVETDS